jgi:phenylpropionate dioxygenase-like ring-hydroxylating dioxygenase large terminal subunit
MPRQQNEWSKRFGIKRMATDRRILEEAEATIGLEAPVEAQRAKILEPPSAVNFGAWIEREMGEQLEFERQKRESLK